MEHSLVLDLHGRMIWECLEEKFRSKIIQVSFTKKYYNQLKNMLSFKRYLVMKCSFGLSIWFIDEEANFPTNMKIAVKHQVCDFVTYGCHREPLIHVT